MRPELFWAAWELVFAWKPSFERCVQRSAKRASVLAAVALATKKELFAQWASHLPFSSILSLPPYTDIYRFDWDSFGTVWVVRGIPFALAFAEEDANERETWHIMGRALTGGAQPRASLSWAELTGAEEEEE